MYATYITRAAVLSVAIATAACATLRVNSYEAPGFRSARYRTFGWAEDVARSSGDPRLDNNTFFHERVQAAVERGLAERGLEKASTGTPDLLLHYHASVTQAIDPAIADTEEGECKAGNCQPYLYDAGTLVLDLMDAQRSTLVWRGWAEDTLDGVIDNQQWLEEKVDVAVDSILKRLPRVL